MSVPKGHSELTASILELNTYLLLVCFTACFTNVCHWEISIWTHSYNPIGIWKEGNFFYSRKNILKSRIKRGWITLNTFILFLENSEIIKTLCLWSAVRGRAKFSWQTETPGLTVWFYLAIRCFFFKVHSVPQTSIWKMKYIVPVFWSHYKELCLYRWLFESIHV